MNAFKKYLRRNGVKLEHDYPAMPWYLRGSFGEPGNILIEGISVNAEKATYTEYYNVLTSVTKVNRDGSLEDVSEKNPF